MALGTTAVSVKEDIELFAAIRSEQQFATAIPVFRGMNCS